MLLKKEERDKYVPLLNTEIEISNNKSNLKHKNMYIICQLFPFYEYGHPWDQCYQSSFTEEGKINYCIQNLIHSHISIIEKKLKKRLELLTYKIF